MGKGGEMSSNLSAGGPMGKAKDKNGVSRATSLMKVAAEGFGHGFCYVT